MKSERVCYMIANKTELRSKFKNVRNSLDVVERDLKSKIICKKTLNLIKQNLYKNVFVYKSFSSETKTDGIIRGLYGENVNIYVPYCNIEKEEMVAVKYAPDDECTDNVYGIQEPLNLNVINQNEIDAIIIPGLAFDKLGNRIGYGKGYYDKYINSCKSNPALIAICYSEQIINEYIDADEHDVKVDMIITDEEDIIINSNIL